MSDSDKELSTDQQKTLAELENQLNESAKKEEQTAKTDVEPSTSDLHTSTEVKKDTSNAETKSPKANNNRVTNEAAPSRTKRASASKNKETKTGLLWFITIINLVLLLAAAGGVYWYWQTQQTNLQNENNALDDRFSSLSSAQSQTKQSLESTTNQIAEQFNKLAFAQENLAQISQANRQSITEVSGRRPADWLLAEADYLTRMAGRKLWLEHDVKTAILMLKSADSRLQDLADPSLIPLRELLANDIQTLNQINPVSLPSVALSIAALGKQVDALPLATIKVPEPIEVEDDTEISASTSDWQDNLRKNWRSLISSGFKTYKVDQPLGAYMSEQQQWLAKEQLKYALMQAQLAALSEQSELYLSALQQAEQYLTANYRLEDTSVITFMDSLQTLLTTDIVRAYPAQLTAAEPLQDTLQQRINSIFVNEAQ